jgi:hypothetical protein
MALDFSTHLLASRYQNLPKNVNICYSDLGLNNDPHKNRDPLLSKRPSSHFELAFQPEYNPVKHVPSTAMRLGKKYIIHSIVCQCIKTSKQHKSGEQYRPQYHGFSSYKNGKRNESQTPQNPSVFICGDHGHDDPGSFHSHSLCLCPDLLPGPGLDYDSGSGAAPFCYHLYPYSCFPSHGRPCHDPGSSLCLPFHHHSHSYPNPCSSL